MINNKQVNLWRGDDPPPTIYHVWIYKNEKILLYNGEEWVVFVNDVELVDKINGLQLQINNISTDVNILNNATVNNKPIKENPVLTGNDILLNSNGLYVDNKDSVSDSIVKLDAMFNTLIIN